ncbi:hypothetical protein MTR67_012428 [Solanum verrucosum]|uniref:Integrase catalytic domain-containing protein n=1 Tax=Solanum verrucosum TaxID=315347 RepID=A0AAF0TK82_SOLVR|nr:hypothetical protein MTR67_012428 [Solanum verrucosum]
MLGALENVSQGGAIGVQIASVVILMIAEQQCCEWFQKMKLSQFQGGKSGHGSSFGSQQQLFVLRSCYTCEDPAPPTRGWGRGQSCRDGRTSGRGAPAPQGGDRDIDFTIDLESGTKPISIHLYRMAPTQLKELKDQLLDLFIEHICEHQFDDEMLCLIRDKVMRGEAKEIVLDSKGVLKIGARIYVTMVGIAAWFGIRLDMTTTFHPQTNGQSERTIQVLEDML